MQFPHSERIGKPCSDLDGIVLCVGGDKRTPNAVNTLNRKNTMKLHSPFLISARLLPAVKVGDAYISIEIAGSTSSGRTRYQYYIDTPTFEHTDTDLKSGCQGGSLESGMESLLAFLEAAAESYRYRGCVYTGDPDDNSSLFPQQVTEWAYQHSDKIGMLRLEIEESETDLIES